MMFADRQSVQLGASGIVFMFILLNSLLRLKSGTIPMTFILQLLLWCNKEIVAQVLVTTGSTTSSISHIAHLSGALVGTYMGYMLHYEERRERAKSIGIGWLKRAKEHYF